MKSHMGKTETFLSVSVLELKNVASTWLPHKTA